MAVVHAYDVSLRASKKREQELKEELAAAQHDSQEKDKQCSKLDNDYVRHVQEDGCCQIRL